MKFGGGLVKFGKVLLAEDGDGDGVFEDERLRVIKLVRGAAESDAQGGAGWDCGLHGVTSVATRWQEDVPLIDCCLSHPSR